MKPRKVSRLILVENEGFPRAYAPGLDRYMEAPAALVRQNFRASLVIKPLPIKSGTIQIYDNMVRWKVSQAIQPEWLHGVTRGSVSADFKGKKRKRLIEAFNRWRMPERGGLFVTLTYPETWPGDWQTWKRDFERWRRKLLEQYPDAQAIWRLELQRRGAPHFHVVLYPMVKHTKSDFIHWNDPVWAEIAHKGSEHHGKYACNVRRIYSRQHAIRYAGKYACKYADAPVDDDGVVQTAEDLGETLGRQWGRIGKLDQSASAELSVPIEAAGAVRRVLWMWGQALGFTWTNDLWARPNGRSWTMFGIGDTPKRDLRNQGVDPPHFFAMLQMAHDQQQEVGSSWVLL